MRATTGWDAASPATASPSCTGPVSATVRLWDFATASSLPPPAARARSAARFAIAVFARPTFSSSRIESRASSKGIVRPGRESVTLMM